MKTLWHDVDLYKFTFILTEDVEEFERELSYDCDPGFYESAGMVSGLDPDKRWFGICLIAQNRERQKDRGFDGVKFVANLSHECVHIAAHVLDSVGAMPRHNQDMEPFCYLHEYLLKVSLYHIGYK